MTKKGLFVGLFFLLIMISWPAGTSALVIINEIAWMGSETSPHDEWIELYNKTNSAIILEGWELKTEDKSLEIQLKGKIPAYGFYLLERTDESTLSNITADQIYKGALSNKGECLQLINEKKELVDEVDCSKGWFAGDRETKKTMERKNPELKGNNPSNWQTSQEVGGTPRAKNSSPPPGEIEKEKNKEEVIPTEVGTKESNPQPVEETKDERQLAAVSKQLNNKRQGIHIFAVALGAALLTGTAILLLKKKLSF